MNVKQYAVISVLIFSMLILTGCSSKPAPDKSQVQVPAAVDTTPTQNTKPSPIPAKTKPASSEAMQFPQTPPAFDQENAAERFIHDHGYTIEMDSGAGLVIQLPASFTEERNGTAVGALLKKENDLSKQNGLDFSGYLGKEVALITYGVENKTGESKNVILVMDQNNVVGFWTSAKPDFNIIVTALYSHNE